MMKELNPQESAKTEQAAQERNLIKEREHLIKKIFFANEQLHSFFGSNKDPYEDSSIIFLLNELKEKKLKQSDQIVEEMDRIIKGPFGQVQENLNEFWSSSLQYISSFFSAPEETHKESTEKPQNIIEEIQKQLEILKQAHQAQLEELFTQVRSKVVLMNNLVHQENPTSDRVEEFIKFLRNHLDEAIGQDLRTENDSNSVQTPLIFQGLKSLFELVNELSFDALNIDVQEKSKKVLNFINSLDTATDKKNDNLTPDEPGFEGFVQLFQNKERVSQKSQVQPNFTSNIVDSTNGVEPEKTSDQQEDRTIDVPQINSQHSDEKKSEQPQNQSDQFVNEIKTLPDDVSDSMDQNIQPFENETKNDLKTNTHDEKNCSQEDIQQLISKIQQFFKDHQSHGFTKEFQPMKAALISLEALVAEYHSLESDMKDLITRKETQNFPRDSTEGEPISDQLDRDIQAFKNKIQISKNLREETLIVDKEVGDSTLNKALESYITARYNNIYNEMISNNQRLSAFYQTHQNELTRKEEDIQTQCDEIYKKTEQYLQDRFIYAGVHSRPNIPVNLREFIRIGEGAQPMSTTDVELVAKHLARVMNKKELDWKQLLSDLHLCFNPQPYQVPPTSFHIPFRQIQDSSENPIKWSDFIDYLKKNRELQGVFQKAFQKEAQLAQKQVDLPTGITPDAQIQARLKEEFLLQLEAMKEWAWEADWFDPTESDRKARDFCQQWVLKYVEFFGQTPLDKDYDFPLFRLNQNREQCVYTLSSLPIWRKIHQLLQFLFHYVCSLKYPDESQMILYRGGGRLEAINKITQQNAIDNHQKLDAKPKG